MQHTQPQQAVRPAAPVQPQQAQPQQAARPAAPAQAQYAQPQQPAQPQPQPQPLLQPQFSQAYAQAVPYQVVPQKKTHGWIVAIVIVVCLFGFLAFCVKSCADSMSSISTLSTASDYGIGGLSKDAIAVLDIDGTIQYDGTACSPEGLKELLDAAEGNENVKALVLRVNSGGGTATAGEEMATYLKQFKKPVVVSSASINASAAYEISSQADYIYVAKSTEIGAIGTAMQLTDLSGLLDKLGVNMEVLTSSDSKDSTYGFRPLTDEEREYYQKMINQINDTFIQAVAEGRHMQVEDVRKLATGLIFTGIDSVENGLADEIGTREDAIAKAAELAGVSDYTTCDLKLPSYDLGSLSTLLGEQRASADDLLALLGDAARAGKLE